MKAAILRQVNPMDTFVRESLKKKLNNSQPIFPERIAGRQHKYIKAVILRQENTSEYFC